MATSGGRLVQAPNDRPVRLRFVCPVCDGGRADAHYRVNQITHRLEWFVGCFSASCRALEGAYLKQLADIVGAPSGSQLKDDPLRWLAALLEPTNGDGTRERRDPLPTSADLARWQSTLQTRPDALAYLRNERGLSDLTIRKAKIGYRTNREPGRKWRGYGAFTIPAYQGKQLANLFLRFWPVTPLLHKGKSLKYAGLQGRGALLYPREPRTKALLVVEGLFDALLAGQNQLPAITSTTGTSWPRELHSVVVGRRAAVTFDAEAYSLARARAAEFIEAGASEAWAVDLGAGGLAAGEDITDWFITHGRRREELIALINAEKPTEASRR